MGPSNDAPGLMRTPNLVISSLVLDAHPHAGLDGRW